MAVAFKYRENPCLIRADLASNQIGDYFNNRNTIENQYRPEIVQFHGSFTSSPKTNDIGRIGPYIDGAETGADASGATDDGGRTAIRSMSNSPRKHNADNRSNCVA